MLERTHFGGLCAVLMCGIVMAGCATPGAAPEASASAPWFDDAAFADERFEADAAAITALSPEMREYLKRTIAPRLESEPARGLVDALYTSGQLGVAYDGSVTRTAAQTFAARRGDCLSLALMTAAFARELGLEIRFQRVLARDVVVADSDLVRVIGHVNVSLGSRTQGALKVWTTIDFLPSEDAHLLRFTPIPTHRVEAMYFNNKAAEFLAVGQLGTAYWWARASAVRDPQFASAYITLGALWDRAGRKHLARAAYGRALSLDPGNVNATNNLALLGTRVQRLSVPTPSTELQRAMVAMIKRGEYEAVRQLALQALQSDEGADLHLILAAAYSGLGQSTKAADELLTYRNSVVVDRAQQTVLDLKIAALRATASTP